VPLAGTPGGARVDTLNDLRLTDAALQSRMQMILAAPALLLLPERLLLYAFVRGVRPQRALEIGTRFGGSAAIICAALDDVQAGSLLCLDGAADVPADLWASIHHRATLVRGHSPAALASASEAAGGPFDFIFIDGDHTADGVARDIDGVLTVAAPGAAILCHDAHYADVAVGIDRGLRRHAGVLVDGGLISTLSTAPSTRRDGTIESWGGLRLLRVAANR
jgi:predicted O-methyltransferase YrrM